MAMATRIERFTTSNPGGKYEAGDEKQGEHAQEKAESAFDEVSNRITEFPQKAGNNEKTESPSNCGPQEELRYVESRNPGCNRETLYGNGVSPAMRTARPAVRIEFLAECGELIQHAVEDQDWLPDVLEHQGTDHVSCRASRDAGDCADSGIQETPGWAPR